MTVPITFRSVKGSNLTASEVDNNFAAAKTAIEALQNGSASSSVLPVSTTFAASVKFDGNRTMGELVVSAPINFDIDPTGSVDGATNMVALIGDGGANAVTFGTSLKLLGAQDYDPTQGQINFVQFQRIGTRYFYAVQPGPLIDTTAPTMVGFTMPLGQPSYIEGEISEAYGGGLPVASAFAVSSSIATTVSSVTAGGDSTKFRLNLASPWVYGQTGTVAYTKPGSGNKLKDASGNEMASFSGRAVSNLLAAPANPFVRLNAVQGANVTETGDSTNGYRYKVDSAVNNAAYVQSGGDRATYSALMLNELTDGWFTVKLEDWVTFFQTNFQAHFLGSAQFMEGTDGWGIQTNGGIYKLAAAYAVGGGAVNGSAAPYSANNNDVLKFERLGAGGGSCTITVKRSIDGGATYPDLLHTFTAAPTGFLRICVGVSSIGTAALAKSSGAAWV